MAKYYVKSKLSENIAKTPEGYLLCLSVPIARIGDQEYFKQEFDDLDIEGDDEGKIIIERPEEEVFSPKAMASFEGKSFTVQHPEEFVDPKNWKELTVGIVSNIRRGTADAKDDLLADILVTDQSAISLVLDGMREISCGYECDYVEIGRGRGRQTNIVGNHAALVDQGRAGPKYAIKDHKGAAMSLTEKLLKLIESESKTKVKDEAGAGEPVEIKATDAEKLASMMDAIMKKLDALAPGKEGEKGEEIEDADKDKEVEAKVDDEEVAPGLEARLKKLEDMVAELMGNEADEATEDEGTDLITDDDDMAEEMGDEDPKEKDDKKKFGDDLSRAEILCPGLKASAKNLRAEAIKGAMKTKDGKAVIEKITAGKAVKFEDAAQVAMVFIAASELLKEKRTGDLSQTRKVRDGQAIEFGQSKIMTPDLINEMNRKHYGQA